MKTMAMQEKEPLSNWSLFISIALLTVGLAFFLFRIDTRLHLLAGVLAVAVAFVLALKYWPEIFPVLFFASGVFKGIIKETVPLFEVLDFTVLLMAISLGITFYRLAKRNQLITLPAPPGFAPTLFFIAILAISLLYSPAFKYGGYKLLSFLAFNLSLFFIAIYFPQSPRDLKRILVTYIYVGVITALLAAFVFYRYVTSGEIEKIMRFTFLGANPISFSAFMSGALLVTLIIWDKNWAFYKKFFATQAILTFVISAIVANSRGPLFSLLLIVAFLIMRQIFLRPRIRYLFASLAIIGLLAIIIALLPENLVSRYDIGSTFSGPSVVQPENTVAMRLKFWQTSLEMATESPIRFFLGHGIGAFGKIWYQADTRWYPHNIFLEILSEQGIIGIVAFILFVLVVLLRGIATIQIDENRLKAIGWCLIILTVYFLLCAQFSGDLNDNRRLWFFLGLMAAHAMIVDRSIEEETAKSNVSG